MGYESGGGSIDELAVYFVRQLLTKFIGFGQQLSCWRSVPEISRKIKRRGPITLKRIGASRWGCECVWRRHPSDCVAHGGKAGPRKHCRRVARLWRSNRSER